MRAEQAAGHLLELLSSGDSKPTGKGRASSLAAWRAQRSHLLELLSSWDSKPTWKAEQAAWQLDGLSDPTFSSYCQVETLNPLERQSKQLGNLMGSAIPPSRAIVEQGRFPHWRHLLGFATPLYPSTGTILYFLLLQPTTAKKKKKNLPYPVFCGFCEDIVWLRAYSIFDIV